MPQPDKKPLTDKQRQAFIDGIPADQRNSDPKVALDNLIERASTTPAPKDSAQSAPDEGYTDTRTHSHTTEDTLDSRSDTSHQ